MTTNNVQNAFLSAYGDPKAALTGRMRELAARLDGLGISIIAAHDHKGELQVLWRHPPQDFSKAVVERLWLMLGESPENVTHTCLVGLGWPA